MTEPWQALLTVMPVAARLGFLTRLKRTRRRLIPIGLNGTIWKVPRQDAIDFIRGLLPQEVTK